MNDATDPIQGLLAHHEPFDALADDARDALAKAATVETVAAGVRAYDAGRPLPAFMVVLEGAVDRMTPEGGAAMRYVPGDALEVRAFLHGYAPAHSGVASMASRIVSIPSAAFDRAASLDRNLRAFYEPPARPSEGGFGAQVDPVHSLVTGILLDVMTHGPISVAPSTAVRDAASIMASRKISCLLVEEGEQLVGIITTGDLTARVVAQGRDADTPVGLVMTKNPITLPPEAMVFDAMLTMSTRGIGHLPIARKGRPVGIVTRTNLMVRQSVSAISMIARIGRLETYQDLAAVVHETPRLLAAMVGAGVEAFKVGHIITSIADALTKRLIVLAERRLGPPPVPYLWLACGSQGRREQTGLSDQDNCLILDDSYDQVRHGAWFDEFARFVCDGLNAAGYVYCPGDMMATNPQWRQPARVWQDMFRGWIAKADGMSQMLSSVMFDLRPISGDHRLFGDLHRATVEAAGKNSIFLAHMIANAMAHTPPLGFLRGFALIRGGDHKNTVDLKHNGVVPIVDMARIYALQGGILEVGTRERIIGAREAGVLSTYGADDLLDAYDLVSRTRLEHQARQIRAGRAPDNFIEPYSLSILLRNHLKDAFSAVKTLQIAMGYGRAVT